MEPNAMEPAAADRARDRWERTQLLAIIVAVVTLAVSTVVEHPTGPILEMRLGAVHVRGDLFSILPWAALLVLVFATWRKHRATARARHPD